MYGACQVALMVKNLPTNAGDVRDAGLIPGQEDPLEENIAIHSSILAWGVPWTEEPGVQGPCDRSLKSEVPCGSCLNWR